MKTKIQEIWNKQYKNIILAICYTIIACCVYCVWVESLWHLWYVDMLVGLLVVALGCVIGYFFIKSELRDMPNTPTIEDEKEKNEAEEVQDVQSEDSAEK